MTDVLGLALEEACALYKGMGYKIKAYDYPEIESADDRHRHLREFNIEELLFRTAGLPACHIRIELLDVTSSASSVNEVVPSIIIEKDRSIMIHTV